ncbi:MAG TPA: hypothetical protein ENH74_11615 [Methylophaga sp.]|nr:hypothetical protein [Methylophaga sp.]HEC60004.1 hypothetical protein [Methylophaga sp.]
MTQNSKHAGNVVMLRGACLWIIMALLLAWSLVGLYNHLDILKAIFPGSPKRVLQAHLDFLIMSALILGFYAAKVFLPWHVRWAMVMGAFTNSSLFLMYALFPTLDPLHDTFNPIGLGPDIFNIYLYTSLLMTSYGFGKASVLVFKSTFEKNN